MAITPLTDITNGTAIDATPVQANFTSLETYVNGLSDGTNLDAGAVSNSILRDSAALSVVGRSANSTGDVADIAAGTDGHVLRRSGTSIGFGTLAAGAFASGTIPATAMDGVYGVELSDTSETWTTSETDNVNWASEDYDPYGFHAASSENIVVPSGGAGYYALAADVTGTSGSGSVRIQLKVNGSPVSQISAFATNGNFGAVNAFRYLADGDVVTVEGVEGSGGASITASLNCYVIRVGTR